MYRKTKAQISCAVSAVTEQLICVFVFAYAKSRFSHAVDRSNRMMEVSLFDTIFKTAVA